MYSIALDTLNTMQTAALKDLKRKRRALQAKIEDGTASPLDIQDIDETTDPIDNLKKTERNIYETVEQHAYNLGQKHDLSSKAFFRPWKTRSGDQWIYNGYRKS